MTKGNKHVKTIINIIYPAFSLFVSVYFTLSPSTQAVLPPPPPDGGYPGGNTAEGTNALFSRTSGTSTTALGFQALKNDTTGGANTAVGWDALFHNSVGGSNTAVGL